MELTYKVLSHDEVLAIRDNFPSVRISENRETRSKKYAYPVDPSFSINAINDHIFDIDNYGDSTITKDLMKSSFARYNLEVEVELKQILLKNYIIAGFFISACIFWLSGIATGFFNDWK